MLVSLTVGGAITYANVMPKENAVQSEGMRTAYMVTGNRVIVRSGPGKQYSQRYVDGHPFYVNKGDILGGGKVKNGYREVYVFNGNPDEYGWVAVQYLKKTRWDDGYDY